MRMSTGVEWALHCCLNLSFLGSDEAATAARLAAFHDLPAAYLNKQLQALVRAGIVASEPGAHGGFRLARQPREITLLDVVTAIEGSGPAFRCAEIRGQGPAGAWGKSQAACTIHAAMGKAALAWRRALADQTLADISATFERGYAGMPDRTRDWLTSRRP
jgi:Rrf2 family protein